MAKNGSQNSAQGNDSTMCVRVLFTEFSVVPLFYMPSYVRHY